MNKIFFLLIALLPILAVAQPTQKVILTDKRTEAIIGHTATIDSILNPPHRDTNFIPNKAGQIVIRPDSTAWISNGKITGRKWEKIQTSAGSTISWGSITGTLSAQTDLQAALAAKQDNLPFGTTSQFIDGTHVLQNLNYPIVPVLTAGAGINFPINTPTAITIQNTITNLNQLTNGPGYITGNQNITLVGDVNGGPSPTSISTTLANVVTAGSCTFCAITVDAKGRVTTYSTGTGTAPVSSVFGRTGAITAQTGDYTAAQVTNAVDQTATYANPSWITSLSWSKITATPTTIAGYGITDGVTLTGTQTLTNKTLTSPLITVGSDANFDMRYYSSTGAATRVGIGSNNQVWTVVGGVPAWATPAGTALSNTHIFVGNGSNVATDVALSGDATITNTGVMTNTGIQNKAITLATGLLKYNGTVFSFDNSTYLTANQSITLTASGGDVNGTATGTTTLTPTWTINNNAVNYAKIQQLASKTLIGNPTNALATSRAVYIGNTFTWDNDTLKYISNITASNGLSMVGTDVRLGGTLAGGTTTINSSGSNYINFNSTVTNSVPGVIYITSSGNSSIGINIAESGTNGTGLRTTANGAGTGIFASSQTGNAGFFTTTSTTGIPLRTQGKENNLYTYFEPASLNDIVPTWQSHRGAATTPVANGVGQSIDFFSWNDAAPSEVRTNSFVTKLLDVSNGAELSEWSIIGVSGGTQQTIIQQSGTGALRLPLYASLAMSGDSAGLKPLGVDAAGNVQKMNQWFGGSGGGGPLRNLIALNWARARNDSTLTINGKLDTTTMLDVNGFPFGFVKLPNKGSLLSNDSVLIETVGNIMYKVPVGLFGSGGAPPKQTTTASSNTTMTLTADDFLVGIWVDPTSNETVFMGTSSGASDVLAPQVLTGGQKYSFQVAHRVLTGETLYISGITSSTVITLAKL